jgi:hypothetical protein
MSRSLERKANLKIVGRVLLIVIGLAMVNGIAACGRTAQKRDNAVHQEQALQAPAEPDYYVHTVRWPGETLGIIAKWYSGDVRNWQMVADANPAINPRSIRIGDMIRIPESILRTREPMPKSFLARFSRPALRHEEAKDQPPESGASGQEDLDLYGPR